MTTNAKTLSISKAQAQKAIDDIINAEISKTELLPLIASDLTIERLMKRNLTDAQARKVVKSLIDQGIVYEFRYKTARNTTAKAYRIK